MHTVRAPCGQIWRADLPVVAVVPSGLQMLAFYRAQDCPARHFCDLCGLCRRHVHGVQRGVRAAHVVPFFTGMPGVIECTRTFPQSACKSAGSAAVGLRCVNFFRAAQISRFDQKSTYASSDRNPPLIRRVSGRCAPLARVRALSESKIWG